MKTAGRMKLWQVKKTAGAKLLLALFAACCLAPAGYADFDDLGAGARAAGMAHSFTALSDDVFGLYYNPAGLGLIRTSQLGAEFGKLYFGLDDNSNLINGFTAVALPVNRVESSKAAVTVSSAAATAPALSSSTVTNLSSGTLPSPEASSSTLKAASYRHLGTFALGLRYFSLSGYYRETAYYLSYGRQVGERWAWGASLKYLQESYSVDDYLKASPVFDYGKKDGVGNVSVDAGVLYNLSPNFFLGASVSDINQPNLGLKENDRLPFTGRLGVAWKEKNISWALDTVFRDKRLYYSTGFERYLNHLFGVRMGLGYGGQEYFNIAGGFSLNLYRVQLDYVFQYPLAGLRDIAGTHRMSLLFRFGRKTKEELEMGSLEYYYAKVKDELANVTQQLTETKSEKENLEQVLIEESTMRIRERIKSAKAEAKTAPAPQAARPAAGPQETTRGQRETRHAVRRGDSLQSIALRYFGDEKYWNEIYQANKENIGRGGDLKPGQVLAIPSLSRPEVSLSQDSPVPVREVATVRVIVPQEPAVTTPPVVEVTPVKVMEIKSEAQSPPAVTRKSAAVSVPAERKKEPAPSGEKTAGPRAHTVQMGENLRSIAQKYYNNAGRWKDIYNANKNSIISGQVTPGQQITIP
ncbi:MAG: LysM peptidoglycan-binding domain-containing protein [Endomicrobiales bacterium]